MVQLAAASDDDDETEEEDSEGEASGAWRCGNDVSETREEKASVAATPLQNVDADDLWGFVRRKVSGFVGVNLQHFALDGVRHSSPCCLVAQVAPQRQNTWVLLANPSSPLLVRLMALIRTREADAEDLLRMMLDTAMWPSEFCPARIAQPRGSVAMEQPMYQHNGWSLEVPGPHRLMLPYRRRLQTDEDEDVDLFRPAFLHLCLRRDAAISAELSAPLESRVADADLGGELLLWSPALAAAALGRPVLECVVGDGKEDVDWIWVLSLFFGVPLVDRTHRLPGRVRCKVLDPLPSRESINASASSLAELMSERAKELRDREKAEGLRLELFWSGGIDSTAALVALIQTPGPPIIVKYHTSSIDEYPVLFDRLKTMPEVELVEIDGSDHPDLEHPSAAGGTHATNLRDHVGAAGSISITGELGDQLFGSHLFRRAFYAPEDKVYADEKDPWRHMRQLGLGAPWQHVLLPMLQERDLIPHSCSHNEVEDALKPWLDVSPIPIVSMFDFLWWTNFSLKWQHVALRMFNGHGTVDPDVCLNRTAHFYQSASFQAWSMRIANHRLKMPDLGKWTSYKWPLKEYIYQFTEDEVYLNTKEKEGSFRHDALRPRNVALDDKFHVIAWGAHSLSRRQLRAKYGDRLLHFLCGVSPFDGHPEFFDEDERRERVANPVGRRTLELKCRSLLPPSLLKGRSVLDLGACLGAMGQWALFHGASSYTAVEVQPDFVRRAQQCLQHWGDRARCIQADTRSYLADCADGSFDIVICAGILHCFLEPLAICVEVQRVAAHAVVIESIHPMAVRAGNVHEQTPMLQVYSEAPVNVQRTFASLTGVSTFPSSAALKLLFGLAGFEAQPVHVPPSSDPLLSIYAAVLPGSVAPVRFFVRFVRREAEQAGKLQSLEENLLKISKAAVSQEDPVAQESFSKVFDGVAEKIVDWQVTGDRFGVWHESDEQTHQAGSTANGLGFGRQQSGQLPEGAGQDRNAAFRLVAEALCAHVSEQCRASARLVIAGGAFHAKQLAVLLNAGFRWFSVVDSSSLGLREYQAAAAQYAEIAVVSVRESTQIPVGDGPFKAIVALVNLQPRHSSRSSKECCKDYFTELFNCMEPGGLLLLSAETARSGDAGSHACRPSATWYCNALEEIGFSEIEILHALRGNVTFQMLKPGGTETSELKDSEHDREEQPSWAAEAPARARELGFLPNEELWNLPINSSVDEAHDSRSCDDAAQSDDVQPSLSRTISGRVSFASLAAQSTEAAGLPTPSDEALASLDLFPEHQCATSLPYMWQKHLTMSRLDAAKLELASGAEDPVSPTQFGSALLSYFPNLIYMLRNRSRSPYFSGNDVDRTVALGRMLSFPVIDRTGTLPNGLRCTVLHKIPEFNPDFKCSLEELMLTRARMLLDTWKTQRLHLLWSGGIDSTGMVIAFHRAATPEEWRERIVLCYAERSKQENPKLYSDIVMTAPQRIVIEGHLRDFINGERIVVLGDPADMLFGTVFMAAAMRNDSKDRYPNRMRQAGLDAPWRSVVPDMLRDRELLAPGHEAEAAWCRFVSPWLDKSPVPIKTVFDFFWWCSFTLKWQHDLLRIFYNRDNVTRQLLDSVNYFYASEDFQQWSFHHHHEKMQDKRVWASYKWPLKEFILRHTGDHAYYAGKIKIPSAAHSWGYQLGLDDRWNILRFGRFCISRARMRERYGEHLYSFVELHHSEMPSTGSDYKGDSESDTDRHEAG